MSTLLSTYHIGLEDELLTSLYRPWTGNSTQCFLSQFNNAMYVLGADESDLSVSPSSFRGTLLCSTDTDLRIESLHIRFCR